VVELLEVAELVYDDIIHEHFWKKRDAVIEIEIPFLGAAPPP
jgi:hypothetical protein